MTTTQITRIVVALVTAGALGACGKSQTPVQATPSPAVGQTGESAAVARARADSLRYPYIKADIDFMVGMIGHHAQAVVMAEWAPSHGASPSVQTLCARILNAQNDEIQLMQRWLRDRNQPVPEPVGDGMSVKIDGVVHQHDMMMPGMLSMEQMRELDAARGPDFDRLFLKYMIQHHKGAVAMVQKLFATDGAAQDELTFKFASDVNVDQTTEIARMEQMLFAVLVEQRSK